MKTSVIRTDSENNEFRKLVAVLDADLAIKNGDDNDFYAQFNAIDTIKNVVVFFADDVAVACGAIKPYDNTSAEVKRMLTLPEYRGKGLATLVLKELENWAAELGFEKCILETGTFMPDAIALYEKNGYQRTENYGQYIGNSDSACFAKQLPAVSR